MALEMAPVVAPVAALEKAQVAAPEMGWVAAVGEVRAKA
jgi:hypothetical protein